MTVLLTENLPLLSGAPDGIKKLRELILELAVRGKLVPQDPSDEPACELLKSITAEQVRLMAEEGLRTNAQSEVPQKDQYLKISAGWAYSRLGNLARFIDYRGRTPTKTSSGIPLITAKNVRSGFISREPQEFIAKNDYSSWMTRGFPRFGDLLFTTEAPMGNVALVNISEQFALAQRVICFQLHEISIGPFLKLAMMSSTFQRQLLEVATGMTATGVKSSRLKEMPVPLPPLAEQHRIVAKVDELMTLCDRLEAQQADAESAHTQLVQALLDSLTQASDATDFATNWQRLAEHFHTLFTTEPSIDALKQTLLQLAVMGKLVQQDPNDEPASELLKRVAEEKVRLVAEGKLKKQKPLADIEGDEVHFDLPSNWAWTRFGNICAIKGELVRPEDFPSLRQIAPDCIEKGTGRLTDNRTVKDSGVKGPNSRFFAGQIVYSKIRPSLSKAVLVDFDGLCSADMYPIDAFISSEFLLKEILSEVFLEQVRVAENRIKMPKLNQESLTSFVLPIPPLAEQHRIVAKVDQLMTLCDQLKTRLTQARELNEQLATTLVERALTENGKQAKIATDRQIARTLLAAEITHRLHARRTFGQRKLQKVIYLAEHAAQLTAIEGAYLRAAAGPHDRHLMNQIEGELQNRKWYERIERETIGHAYRPLSQSGQHRQAYSSTWSVAERATIEQVIELMRDWDTDRCEMTVTLYAAWNDFILEGRPVSDEAIVDEVMHSWNDTKLRFGKTEWLAVLAEMKKHKILMPSGFGKRTTGGMLSLPGFE
ncbi:restriction endonuclease subunit S [Pseudomonas sp. REP124]|uniref:restriction endonuclease subunit S n=1 Tax=Pseudomonas sp. REP124 TaxID=2875731 RepID=UPI001CCD175E|nr:restriction endonuclease subunit S [Pseudomonas sp. REP124]MBZ9783340.1 restriction endonuclease subunit S [Pseudomonas sp. REP124]